MGFLIWDVMTRTGSFTSFSFRSGQLVGTTRTHTLNSSSIVGQLTFNNDSFINATVTIIRPINLNGSIIRCNNDMLTLNIPTKSGKFMQLFTGIIKRKGVIHFPEKLMYT